MKPGKETKESIPDFVIVIAVTHSLEDLELCLSSLDNLVYPKERFHVVLADCHVLPELEQFADRLSTYEFQTSMLVLPERVSTHPRWLHEARLNEARNRGIREVPGRCYVFTEDDCSFEPEWLNKFETSLTDNVGASGSIDVLPDGMGRFPRALDCVINSFIGTAGTRRA